MLAHVVTLQASYRGVPFYNTGQQVKYSYTQNFRTFPQSLQANVVTISDLVFIFKIASRDIKRIIKYKRMITER
jgi:hypothetical protein